MRGATVFLILTLPLAAAVEGDTLASLSRKFVETGSPAAREALARFAEERNAQPQGALARFVLGFQDYQEKKFASAAEQLGLASEKPSEVADYAVYYRALALAAAGNHADAARVLADFAKRFPASALVAAATRQRAESLSLTSRGQEALKLLPAAPATASEWLLLAQVAARAGEPIRAARAYQRVYFGFPASAEQAAARAAAKELRAKLGARYPAPEAALRLARADGLLSAQKYTAARSEYRALSLSLKGLPREQAAVRIGACDYHLRAEARGYRWLKSLKLTRPEAAAESLYHLAVCARRLKRPDEFTAIVARLGREHRDSSWHEEALFAAGNYFLLENDAGWYVPYYRSILEIFPRSQYAAAAHWKIAWSAYLDRSAPDQARRLLEDHLRRYPDSPQLTAALYWLGRLAETRSDWAAARALYTHLTTAYPLYYHSVLAQDRAAKLPPAGKGPAPASVGALLAALPSPPPPPPVEPSPEMAPYLRRARLLAGLGLAELADRELRFRAESGRLAYHAGLELAKQAAERGNYQQSIRFLKRYTPRYLAFPLEALPAQYWELLFPMPWRQQIEGYSQMRDLDPYLVAALIRQESEFNPGAVSPARARGLMQLMLPTGRRLGRSLGMNGLSVNHLYVPETSLRLGTLHLRRVLDQYDGRLELALAGYNAGESRVEKWLGHRAAADPAEFVESIPFTETRNYVQAVLRNAEIYRKLYGS